MPAGIDPIAVAFTVLSTVNTALLGIVVLGLRSVLRGGLIPFITHEAAVKAATDRAADAVQHAADRVADAVANAEQWRSAAGDWRSMAMSTDGRLDTVAARLEDLTEATKALAEITERGNANLAALLRGDPGEGRT